MIAERHTKQAKRTSNGEMVKGYIVIRNDGVHYIVASCVGANINYDINNFIGSAQEVDPATVEDVAVKVNIKKFDLSNNQLGTRIKNVPYCPNCDMPLDDNNRRSWHCSDCGQRLEWEEAHNDEL